MVIQLYHFGISPPSRSAYWTLKALGLEHEVKIVDLFTGEQKKPEFLAVNPRGKVPALVDGDLKLSESRAIAAYLCNKYAKGEKKSLYPSDPDKRAVVDMQLYISEWIFEQLSAYMNLAGIFFRGDKSVKEDKLDGAKAALKLLDDILKDKKYLAGDTLTIADYFSYPCVLFLDAVKFSGYGDYPNIVLWMGRMKADPFNEDVNSKAMQEATAATEAKLNPKE